MVSEAMQEKQVAKIAEEIAARCGAGYAVDSMQKETRAIATVYPQTAEARRDNYHNNTIEKALR